MQNYLTQRDIIQDLKEETFKQFGTGEIVISTFYKFVDLKDCEKLQKELKEFCVERDIKGTIILANEGINGSVSANRDAMNKLYEYFDNSTYFSNMECKESLFDKHPFGKTKIRLKQEIVRLKGEVNLSNRGEYISPENWDDFISQENVILIDNRNDYEYDIGTFEGSINPQNGSFFEFKDYVENNLDKLKNKKVAMFCTGGVRCEKSTSYMKSLGIEDVFHLEGGVLGYFMKTGNANSKWKGGCFVFDDRSVIDEKFNTVTIPCEICGEALTADMIKAKSIANSDHKWKECNHRKTVSNC